MKDRPEGMKFRLEVPITPVKLWIFVGDEYLEEYFEKTGKGDIEIEAEYRGLACIKGIWCKDYVIDTLVHETHHVATDICTYFSIEDEEFVTYLQEYLYTSIITRWEKKIGKDNIILYKKF